jgi:transcriptional regulator with XRE-family HTH domain
MTKITSGEQIMDAVRDELDGEPVATLAVRTGLSKSTIYAIRRGKTRWPRDYTLFALTYDLGLEVRVVKTRRNRG